MSLSENIENAPFKPRPTRAWHYCYSCGANRSHPSPKCTSKCEHANHKNEATFKDVMGGSKRKLKVPAVCKTLNQN